MGKIVLSTDYHLKFHSVFDHMTDSGLPSRLDEIMQSIDWASDFGKKHKAEYFLSLGDVFDSPERLNTKEGLAIAELFRKIGKKYSNKTFFIPGNHDCLSANHNILDLFSDTINVFSEPTYVDIPGARLFFLPYIRESEDVYAKIEEFKKKACLGRKYLFAHFWDDSVMGVDPDAIKLNKIDLSFFDRVFLGHYHVPSQNKDSKVIYLGTLLNKKFNETGPKGCWILDLENNKVSFHINPNSPEFFSVQDTNVLTDVENLITNGYYRVACDPETVLEVTKILSKVKGFELVSKKEGFESSDAVSILNVEKKNASSLKDYIITNCNLFTPSGITEEEFKKQGETFLAGL